MGLFSDTFIRRVRDANDITQVVESYSIPLRRTGTNFLALCPFHNEKTPSFNVNPQLQIFKCFGCGVGGDVFKFVQLMERIEFPEAVEFLANRAGIAIEREHGHVERARKGGADSKEALRWANSQTLRYFEQKLAGTGDGKQAREYLLDRGFSEGIIGSWRLGWAPESWDGLLETLVREAGEHKRETVIEVGLNAGVLRRNEAGRVYDAFRGRVMFPILDNQHRPVGFGGRVLEEKPEAGGKYINTSEGALFQKRRILFGLNFAAKEIGLTHAAVIVEGYTDTILCHQHGVRNAVATLGTSLTREHIHLLRRYVQPAGKVIALFDSDAAGEKATFRAIELFMEEDVPLHIVRGLEVKDAGEFLPQFGAEAFLAHLEKAEDAFSFSLRCALEKAGNEVSGRAAAVGSVMQLVNRCPNRVKREMMRREVATAAGVSEESLPRKQVQNAPGQEARRPAARGGMRPAPRVRAEMSPAAPVVLDASRERRIACERRLLRYMIEQQDWCERIADRLPPDHFSDGACAGFAAVIRDEWNAGRRPEAGTLTAAVTEEDAGRIAADLFMGASETPLADAELTGLLERLEREALDADLLEIRRDLQQAQQAGDVAGIEEALQRKIEVEVQKRRL